MPVSARDMNGYRDFERGHLRTSSYTNGYDPYRRDREDFSPRRELYHGDLPTNRSEVLPSARSDYLPYAHSDVFTSRSYYRDRDRGRHNGFDDYEQNSYDGGMRDGLEMAFEVDHLATYTSKSGTTRPEDGLTKLKQMESSTGIWTMRCTMVVERERNQIVVVDKGNGEELERFPLSQVLDPTAVLKNDRRETYNNLVLFTVIEDPRNRKSASDMHIFQSVNAPAHHIVDEILASKGESSGQKRGAYESRIPPPPSGPAPEPPYGKSLKQSHRFVDTPPLDDEPIQARPIEIGLGATQLRESRFNDASQWINEYYSTTPRRTISQNEQLYAIPYKGSVGRAKALGLDYPDYSSPAGFRSGSYTMENKTSGKSKGKAGNIFGTWSGRNLDKGSKSLLKKGKKWYKFNFSKNSMRKTRSPGKENDGYTYSSSTLPLTKSSGMGNYSTSTLQRYKQNGGVGLERQWTASRNVNVADEGRYGGGGNRASYFHHTELDTGQNEALEKDVQLLNNCFDDIEKFVSRLQQAAEAYKELERRRMDRGNKRKNRVAGDGMLTMRARPPPAEDFIDIFQKFKFAFNLLAKLKAHIHDPNAPELVHFLFTPLSLIFEASRDPIHNNRDLSGEAVAPLLLVEAKQLLLNCLTSKELELWQRLGKPWTLTKDEWHGYVPSYSPRFYNGWQPSLHEDDVRPSVSRHNDEYRRDDGPYRDFRATERPMEYRPIERDDYSRTRRDEVYTQEIRPRDDIYNRDIRSDYRSPSPPPSRGPYSENKRTANTSIENIGGPPRSRAEENLAFAQELKRKPNATIYEAVHDRQSKHHKELTVEKGDVFEVLDHTRNWWKLKNCRGETGHAPYTILKEYQPREEFSNSPGRPLSGDYSSYINGQAPPAPPPPSSRAGRGDGHYERDHKPPQPPAMRSRQDNGHYERDHKPSQPQAMRSRQDRNRYADDLHNELRIKMNTSDDRSSSPRSPRSPKRPVNIAKHSTADEVVEWLESKGFSRRCIQLLHGYTGHDMFGLHREELERLLGRDEGRHLDSLLTVQKNNSGYRQSGTSELKAILERRKERLGDDDKFGARPSFMPETPPDYSPAPSDASSDDFGDAGKTLRHLLERQRKKIQSDYYQKYD